MPQKIFITKFNYSLPAGEFRNVLSAVAKDFADVPGCQWKIWLIDEEKNEAGAIYLFESGEALENFKASPVAADVISDPSFSNFDFRTMDIVKEPSLVTKAPLMGMTDA